MGHHINENNQFQSDLHPDLGPDKIVLSFKDPGARRALFVLAEDYTTRDREFADDITTRLDTLKARELRVTMSDETREIIHRVDVTGKSDNTVERVMMGMIQQMRDDCHVVDSADDVDPLAAAHAEVVRLNVGIAALTEECPDIFVQDFFSDDQNYTPDMNQVREALRRVREEIGRRIGEQVDASIPIRKETSIGNHITIGDWNTLRDALTWLTGTN